MFEKLLKLIQGGNESLVPDNVHNRKFWSKQNAKIAGSQNAQNEMVTIMPATEQEMASYYAAQKPTTTIPVAGNKMEALEKQLAQQQELINKLLLAQIPAPADAAKDTEPAGESEPTKERAKPGPKPKINTDGESDKTENAKA